MPSQKKWPSRPRRASFLTLPLLLSAFIAGCGDGIPDFTPQELAEATARVEEAYHLHDYEFGAELGEKWAAWAPDALELKAWTVANFCGAELNGLAAGMAEEMVATQPDSPWSAFALGMARVAEADEEKGEEALAASEKALAGLPDLVDAVILRGHTLFLFLDPDSAMAFAGTLSESQMAHPDVRAAMAEALFEDGLNNLPSGESGAAMYEKLRAEALSRYEEILQEHPSHITANLEAASFTDDSDMGCKYAQRAAGQTFSPSAHLQLWGSIHEASSLTEDQKRELITSDLHDVLENGGDSPARYAALAIALGSEGMTELQADLDEKVLGDHETSWAAEMILRDRIQTLAKEIWAAPSLVEGWGAERREKLAGMLGAFIGRSRPYEPEALLGAHWAAFLLERESPEADPATLKRLADGVMAQMEAGPGPEPDWYYTLIALTLAENPATLEDATNIINQRVANLEEREAQAEKGVGDMGAAVQDGEAGAEEDNGEAEACPETQAERAVLSGLMGRALLEEGRKVEKWMDDRGYHFPVLWGGKFASSAGVTSFPTTWVVDRDGTIAFRVVGSAGPFAQEFGWRVEDLLRE